MLELKIHAELKNLLPSLTDAEYHGLEADIIIRGCLSPIIVWNDAIVDGHNSYEICQKHGIPFEIKRLEFASIEEARFWAWTHQDNRRNMTAYQRIEIAKQFKPMLVAKAKAKMSAGGSKKASNQGFQTSGNLPNARVHVDKELAKTAGVSHDTMHKAEFLSEHADEETKENLRRGKTTINREYKRTKEKVAQPKKPRSKKTNDEPLMFELSEKPKTSESSPSKNVPCIEELEPPVVRTTLKNIRQNHPDHLLINLNMHFRKGYIEELVIEAMAYLHKHHGGKVTIPIAKKIAKTYLEK